MSSYSGGASWRTCFNASSLLKTWHLHIKEYRVRKVVLKPIQQRFTGFIPNHVMALPSQPFSNGRANRLLIVGHKDDCLYGLAFHQLDILG